MAINQSPMQRTITLPVQTVTAGTGLEQFSNAVSAVSSVLVDRANQIAIESATQLGAQDALDDKAPASLMPGITKATTAYNNSVANVETRRMIASAEEQINEALIRYSDPATFTNETPAHFNSALEGIKQGVLEHARPQTIADISLSLDKMTSSASNKMLAHSISYDNKRTQNDFKTDIERLSLERRNAIIEGESDRVRAIDEVIDQTITDYSVMNQQIASASPAIKESLEKEKLIDGVLQDYFESQSNNTTAQYLESLSQNKQHLPFDVWQKAAKIILQTQQSEQQLSHDLNAQTFQGLKNSIANGSVEDEQSIFDTPNLTPVQQLQLVGQLDARNREQFKQQETVLQAQRNILSNRSELISTTTRNEMFEQSVQNFEQATGRKATLIDMKQMILGLNEYPVSGLPQTPLGTNVPAFDALVQGKLTSGDVLSTIEGAVVYNDLVNIEKQPNAINLSGQALSVATSFNTLNQGTTSPEQAAQIAIKTVINAKDPEIQERSERYHREYEYVNPHDGSSKARTLFKDVVGVRADPFKSDAAFNVFKDTFRMHYINSNSEQAALKAATYAMRSWGTSKYFDEGMVAQPVPEKELGIVSMGNAFDNMMTSNLQGFINRNKLLREQNPDLVLPEIDWENPAQTINGTETDEQKVFNKFLLTKRPRIKINGHATDIVLIPDPQSRLGNRISYAYGYYDRFNNLQVLNDPSNTVTGTASFIPQDINQWAPNVAQRQWDDELKKTAVKTRRRDLYNELNIVRKANRSYKNLFGLIPPLDAELETIAAHIDEDENETLRIFNKLKGENPSQVREEIFNADNVGISPEGSS